MNLWDKEEFGLAILKSKMMNGISIALVCLLKCIKWLPLFWCVLSN